MLLNKLINGLNIIETNLQNFQFEIKKISYDSKDVNKDSIFIAIKGFKYDGHNFIKNVIDKNCKIIICEYKVPEIQNINYIIVKDSRIALSIISSNFFDNIHKKIKIIGVTGTNGKTTVTTLLYQLLKFNGYKVSLIGTNKYIINDNIYVSNNTTPESYQLHKLFYEARNNDYIIMEVSSHSIKLNRIFGITFYISLFTNITHDHLDFHKTFDDYLYTKSLLFLNSQNAVINIDDQYSGYIINKIQNNINFISYSISNNNSDIYATNINFNHKHSNFNYINNITSEKYNICIPTPGLFYIYNILAVISILYLLNIQSEKFIPQIKKIKPVEGRFELINIPKKSYLIIDYAHTPDGMLNVLLSAKKISDGKLICLFGCGGDRDKSKRSIMGKIAYKYSDFIIVTSDNPRTENPYSIINDIILNLNKTTYGKKYIIIENRKKAIFYALNIAKDNDIILLLGKGHEKYQEINNIKYNFNEYQIVMEFFKETK